MSRETPEASYEHARDAMRRRDLPEVFACLDVNDCKRIAENAVALSLGAGIGATMHMRDTMKRGLAGVANLPSFLAALEGESRRVSGGGSISMRLFQNETLTDLHIDGAKARGRRVFDGGEADAVEFVRRKGEWYIRLISRITAR